MKSIRLATRQSPLAMVQAKLVQSRLLSLYPDFFVNLLPMTTEGDRKLDVMLSKIGGKGLFIKALEVALQESEADFAVHSLKDLPTTLSPGFKIVAITERENPLDAFVSNQFNSLDALPEGAIVGTSSLRRASQLKLAYPDVNIQPLRGNLGTRLSKLDEGQFDAIILASAGLNRLGFSDRVSQHISEDILLPAAGQGALAIEVYEPNLTGSPLLDKLASLNDTKTHYCVCAERALLAALGGGCHLPLAAYAVMENSEMVLKARLVDIEHQIDLQVKERAMVQTIEEASALGKQAAESLLCQGAWDILPRFIK